MLRYLLRINKTSPSYFRVFSPRLNKLFIVKIGCSFYIRRLIKCLQSKGKDSSPCRWSDRQIDRQTVGQYSYSWPRRIPHWVNGVLAGNKMCPSSAKAFRGATSTHDRWHASSLSWGSTLFFYSEEWDVGGGGLAQIVLQKPLNRVKSFLVLEIKVYSSVVHQLDVDPNIL